MKTSRSVCLTVLTFALVLFLGATAEAQLPKQGEFTGKFGWWAVGKAYELDKGHLYWSGEFNGAIFNDAGNGFIHGTSWVCPGYNELRDGITLGSAGRCVGTDADGDKIFNTWHGDQGTFPGKVDGTYDFVGGTGKYAGIRGHGTFHGNFVPTTEQGFTLLTGDWQLP